MCVAIYKPQNVDFPSWRKLEKCFRKNPDGAGFMWIENGAVHVRKGFMKWEDFKKALKPYKNDARYTKIDFGIHFRISTQGGVNTGCTHPFPLTTDIKTLQATTSEAEVACIHNGIIPLTTTYTSKSKLSDTMLFVKDYMTAIAPTPSSYRNPYIIDVIEEVINSKMLIFCNDGTVQEIGRGWENIEGVHYSNTYWMDTPRQIKHTTTSTTSRKQFTPDYYNGWEEDWYSTTKTNKYKVTDNLEENTCLFELTGDWDDCYRCTCDRCYYWEDRSYI